MQVRYENAIATVRSAWAEIWNIAAAKDFGNTIAFADLVIDGKVLAKSVPATHLLTLEKALANVQTFVTKISELDQSETWNLDANTGLHRTDSVRVNRTTKRPEVIVLHAPTEHHPAQTQLANLDVDVGFWTSTKFSGGIPKVVKTAYLDRIDKALVAVRQAREKANMTAVSTQSVGSDMMSFIFDA